MKTLKEVVDECGFPVFVTINHIIDVIITENFQYAPSIVCYLGHAHIVISTEEVIEEDYITTPNVQVSFYQPLKEAVAMKTLKEVVEECGFPVFVTLCTAKGEEILDSIILGDTGVPIGSYKWNQIVLLFTEDLIEEEYYSDISSTAIVSSYQPLKEVTAMKTLKEVVEECGFPVFVVTNGGVETIIVAESTYTSGNYPTSGNYHFEQRIIIGTEIVLENDNHDSYPPYTTISDYQPLKDELLEAYNTIKTNMKLINNCTCPTLLSGHHKGCYYAP